MNATKLRRFKWQRSVESTLLIIGLSANLAGLGWMLGGSLLALLTALGMLVIFMISPAVSPDLIVRLYRGRRIFTYQAPRVYALVSELSRRAGLKDTPILYYLKSSVPNALAVGTKDRSGIALSDGLLRKLSMTQLSAVLAHEISHIINNDTRRNTLAVISVKLTQILGIVGHFLLLLNLPLVVLGAWRVSWALVAGLILAPIVGNALVTALSRVHEYQADLQAVELTGDPQALASALWELDACDQDFWQQWLRPKLSFRGGWGMFMTHPATQERIKRLEEIWDANAPRDGEEFETDTLLHQQSYGLNNTISWPNNSKECLPTEGGSF